jgi:hypothetical protein
MTPRSAAVEACIWLCRTDLKPCDVAVAVDGHPWCRWYDVHGSRCTSTKAKRLGEKRRRANGKKS